MNYVGIFHYNNILISFFFICKMFFKKMLQK